MWGISERKQSEADRQFLLEFSARLARARDRVYWELALTTPRHGDRPLEIVHIDHTELDVETVCSRNGRVLGRPCLTLLMDAYSRRILALYLTFDSPSYRSLHDGVVGMRPPPRTPPLRSSLSMVAVSSKVFTSRLS